jgi:hypothetical protein
MGKSISREKSGSSGKIATMSEKEMLSHLPGIRIVKNGKIPAGILDSEIHDLAYLPKFALCACYLGYVDIKIRRRNRISIPVDAIWELFNFTSGLETGTQTIDQHLMIIDKAIELLGFDADIYATDQYDIVIDRISRVTCSDGREIEFKCMHFYPGGMEPDIFFRLLAQWY